MTRVTLHIGPDPWASTRIQDTLADKRAQLAEHGVVFARSPGPKNHTRLFMAVCAVVDTLRANRGFASPQAQARLRADVTEALHTECAAQEPDHFILSAHQFGSILVHLKEIQALKEILSPLSEDIRIVAHVDAPSEMLARHYASQVLEGRARSLGMELGFLKHMPNRRWWDQAISSRPESKADQGVYPDVQGAPAFIDLGAWIDLWSNVFGADAVSLRVLDQDTFASASLTKEICKSFDLPSQIGKADAETRPRAPSAIWLARSRSFNDLMLRHLSKGKHILPRQLWRKMLGDMRISGPSIDAHFLGIIDAYFESEIGALAELHPPLGALNFGSGEDTIGFIEPEPSQGFRASQYLLANLERLDSATREKRDAQNEKSNSDKHAVTSAGQATLPPLAAQNLRKLIGSPYAPHNRLGHVNEEALSSAFAPAKPRSLEPGSTGNVIVACMKNEAPYIVEWVAYHRAIGIDTFVIYTNGCNDTTDDVLQRLQAMGVVHHRDNENWKGNSPQQYALNQALKEPVVQNADWLIHIDVDEFMNIRCGNGTLDDFLERVPDATNVAMTWRLFGHNGVTRLSDAFVIDQFDMCAPKYCPKPHTVWGFKTMFKNNGAYGKMSCHRPNKLKSNRAHDVVWVNGSGQLMGDDIKENGWRNSKRSIGYDLLQLNHYALRSADSFLIKRQRGRALHVDRSIGLNYWIRMDWSNFRDITIKRNIPRVRGEYDRLMSDRRLREAHDGGLAWHRAKAKELHKIPEFEELYRQALALKLTETERVAYALALDMES
ncbi:MAG: glycosyltransferase family 2 protein [Marinovum sp.]|nr:glycosyltransferase family 2 protein [Marinovum sp.]